MNLNINLSTTDYALKNTGIEIKQNDFGTYSLIFTGISASTYDSVLVKFQRSDDEIIVDNEVIISDDAAEYIIKNNVIAIAGDVQGEVSYYKDSTKLTSNTFKFTVIKDINTTYVVNNDDRLPVLDNLIVTVQGLQTDAEALNDETQAINTQSQEIAELAQTSAATASQAMTDLLAMIGADIATLVGGKVPISQIPATAIHDLIPINSVDDLVTLTAQKGDVAYILTNGKITTSYQLLADDATVLSNWAEYNTGYATQAGHAATAGEAENATMINNHRVVVMTQAQYDIAVKDADTVYLVGV